MNGKELQEALDKVGDIRHIKGWDDKQISHKGVLLHPDDYLFLVNCLPKLIAEVRRLNELRNIVANAHQNNLEKLHEENQCYKIGRAHV